MSILSVMLCCFFFFKQKTAYEMRISDWSSDVCSSDLYEEIPADLADKAAEYREKLVELAVEQDDDAMEAYLEGTVPAVATLKELIRKGTLAQAFVPFRCVSAFTNTGVQTLHAAAVD